MNRKLIIALIFIVLIVLFGLVIFSHSGGTPETKITFLSNGSLKNGEQVQFQLTDTQGNALAGQNVTISFGTEGEMQKFFVTTDSEGKGGLLIENENPGTYNVTVTYSGDAKHNGTEARQTITIGEDYISADLDASSYVPANSSSSSSSESSDLSYDSELNVNYNSEGIIVGGQNDGASYDYIKNNPQEVDEEGNLV